MIVYHQDNVAAFAGAHTWIWVGHPLLKRRISVTTAVAAAVLLAYKIEMELAGAGGGWSDTTVDVMRDPIRWSRGIFGSGPKDVTGRPGVLTFTMNNTAGNSGQKLGYYSPGHANVRSGFDYGIAVRLWISDGTNSRYKFRGRLRAIGPEPGEAGPRGTVCIATDWLADFEDLDAADLTLRESVSADDLIQDLIDLAPVAPANVSLNAGIDAYAFAFDDLGGRVPKAAAVAQRVMQSEGAPLYLIGDATDGETLRMESRHTRASVANAATYTAADIAFEPGSFDVPSTLDRILNDVEVQIKPRRVDSTATTVLVKLDKPVEVAAGATEDVWADFRDPGQEAEFVGGKDMVDPPASTTDWTANTAEDGAGSDITSDFSVVAAYFGSRAKVSMTNNGSVTGYVRGPGSNAGLQARGKGLYRYSPVTSRATNAASVTARGKRQLPSPLLLPYQGDRNVAKSRAEFIAFLYGSIENVPVRIRLLTEKSGLLGQGILRDIGDKVTLSEPQTGVTAVEVFINAIEQEISIGQHLRTWFTLAPADTSALMILDDPVAGKFDQNVLGY